MRSWQGQLAVAVTVAVSVGSGSWQFVTLEYYRSKGKFGKPEKGERRKEKGV
mgnify:FL=1|jgi:hypothetical protein